MKTILFVIFTISIFCQLSAQQEPIAFASSHGIFIKLENDYPVINKSQLPVYEIKRRVVGEKSFKTLATVTVPDTYETFVSNVKAACNVNPEPLLFKEVPAELLWKKFSAGGFDSIEPYRNAIFLQLALGIKYFDATAEKNITYEYEITKSIKAIKYENTVISNTISYPVKPITYKGNLSKEKESVLAINLQYTCTGEAPALIRVYREENTSGNFVPVRAKRIKTVDKDTTTFAIYDTVVRPNMVYRYYVLPMDYYGNYGKISDTITAIAASRQYAGNIERMDVVSFLNEGTAIRWELSDPQNFNAVAIYRTTNFDSSLVKIGMASAADTQFIDAQAEPMTMYFYALQPITRAGATMPMSAKVTGMFTPKSQPLAPYIMDAVANKNAIILTIKNNDTQTRGYRIYRKLNTDSAYTLISDLIKLTANTTQFIDSGNLVTGKFYTYMVKAENKSYILSPASNQITVKSEIPTTLIPIGIPKVEIVNNTAVIQWKNTLRTGNINTYAVYRKDASGKTELLQENISNDIFRYTDSGFLANKNYTYGIAYNDVNGNVSEIVFADPVKAEITRRGPATVYGASNANAVIISWNAEENDITAYKIYQLNNEQPELIGEVKNGVTSYTINNVKQGESYTIYITTIDKNAEESLPGKIISVYAE